MKNEEEEMTLRSTEAEAQRIEGRSLLSRVHYLVRTNSSRWAIKPRMFRIVMRWRHDTFGGPRRFQRVMLGRSLSVFG